LKKNKYLISILFILIFICLAIVLLGRYSILQKEKQLLNEKYKTTSQNFQDKANSLIQTKKNATLAIALTLSEDERIKDILLNNESGDYNLDKLSQKMREYTNFKNVWFHIINKDGFSVYRSWTNNKNDKIKDFRLDLEELLKNPSIKSTISVGIYDITFKSMIPLYKNDKFIGVLESITHFNSITKELIDSHGVEPIILVNSIFTKQLKDNGFTKIFLQNQYVANLSVSKKILDYLEHKEIDKFLGIKNYVIEDEKLIINIPIIENEIKLADILIFKDLNQIDISEIIEFKKHAFFYLITFLLFLCFTIFIIGYYLYTKRLKELNIILQQTVHEEIAKNDEKNKILFQQNKMAAMGEMIANIAHQWRQPLSMITTVASSVKLKKELGVLEEGDCEESLIHIVETANYLSNTIDDFQYYFSPNKRKNDFNTKDLIDKSLKLYKIDFKEKKFHVIKNIDNIKIINFENELLQVIINILNNAKDELLKKDIEKYIFIDAYKENQNYIINIKDNAGGISEEIIDRIFEPYFTTKHKSKGTGLGLYMCQEIMLKHINGTIRVFSEKYTYKDKEFLGARFEIVIPI
jgi:two-component system, NtrC family, C4-dicarboxylate transport sensor histidine kinase DctB